MSLSPHTTTSTSTIAVVGNPNTGKTTLFNALTGLAQHVGNYTGVTVERKIGKLTLGDGSAVDLLDLPGAYSLAANSPDEMIVVDVLLGQRQDAPAVDAVLSILDATNLRRNMYLLSQVMEAGLPIVVALNMSDLAESRHIDIDAESLSRRLGVPVVPICASRRQGLDALRQALAGSLGSGPVTYPSLPRFPRSLRQQVDALVRAVDETDGASAPLSKVEALRALVDTDGHAESRLRDRLGPQFAETIGEMRRGVGIHAPLASFESESRYMWVDQALDGIIRQPQKLQSRPSDRIDRILTNRVLGFLIFVAVSGVVFQGIYHWSVPLMDAISGTVSAAATYLSATLPDGALRSLIVDGVFAGVGGVLVFLPQIAMLFLFISVLEDCGYMARAAFLMDRLLSRCGLSGQSFIPLLSSFACAVPGIMATRTIGDRRDRFATIAVAPLMSCSARLPVYVLFIAAFIPDQPVLGSWIGLQGLTLLCMYFIGVFVAIPIAWLLKKTVLSGEAPSLLLELPSYKWPDPRTIALRVYHSSRAFVVRAGTIIFAATIVMWALAYFPRSTTVLEKYEQRRSHVTATAEVGERQAQLDNLERLRAAELLETSYLGQMGHFVAPAVRPLGWDWRIGMAAIASFPAREVIISVLGTIYSLGGDQDEGSADLRGALRESTWPDGTPVFSVPVALSIMVFFALCAQCMSTLAVIQRETGSWHWAAFTFGYMTALAYVGALVTYRVAGGL